MDKTALGDRMKAYERQETARIFLPGIPIVARMDGRSFSKFTKDMQRPFDFYFTKTMQSVTQRLVEKTNADIGYTQSDEITLIWKNDDINKELMFGNKKFKWHSILSAMTTMLFNGGMYSDTPQMFDARVFQVPNLFEASNVLMWREQDAVRNSIQMLARSLYSHNECNNKNTSELQEMCFQKGHNWNDLHSDNKRGSYFKRSKTVRKFTAKELESLPEKHQARTNPDLEIERHDVSLMFLEILSKYTVEERLNILFGGE